MKLHFNVLLTSFACFWRVAFLILVIRLYIVFLVGIGRVWTEEASATDQREEGVKQRRGLSRSTRGYIARWVSTSPLSGEKSRFLSFAFQLKFSSCFATVQNAIRIIKICVALFNYRPTNPGISMTTHASNYRSCSPLWHYLLIRTRKTH